MHSKRSDISKHDIVRFDRVDGNDLTEAVGHEMDVFEGAPRDLTAMLEITYVYSTDGPDVELFVAALKSFL